MDIEALPELYQRYGLKPVRGVFHIKDYADPLTVDYLHQHQYITRIVVEDEEIEKWAEMCYTKEYIYGFAMAWDNGGIHADLDKEPEKYIIGYRDGQRALRAVGNVTPAKLIL